MPLLEELKPRTSYLNLANVIADLSLQSGITEDDLVGSSRDEKGREAHASVRAYPLYRYMSALEKTEIFLGAYAGSMVQAHDDMGLSLDWPRYATDLVLEEVRELRQAADALGIPYEFFCQHATRFWLGRESRTPRMRELVDTEVLAWVAGKWSRPSLKHAESLFPQEWDLRFRAEHYVGDGPQEAVRKLLIERIKFLHQFGFDAAEELLKYIDTYLPYNRAAREFDAQLLEDAFSKKSADDMIDDFLSDL